VAAEIQLLTCGYSAQCSSAAARAGVGLSCTISVTLEMAGRVSRRGATGITQGCGDGPSLLANPPATGERQTI
jgi:hypothetical protein